MTIAESFDSKDDDDEFHSQKYPIAKSLKQNQEISKIVKRNF